MYRVLISELANLSPYKGSTLQIEVDETLAGSPDQLVRRAAGKDALVVRNLTRVTAGLIARLKESTGVKVIGRLGVGLDNVDVQAARAAGMQVVYTPDANTEAVAQYALGQILQVTRNLGAAHESTARGEWNRQVFTGRELSELTVGVVGLGRIGGRLASILSSFGCRILVAEQRTEMIPQQYTPAGVATIFAEADVVSVHVPLVASTRGLFRGELFQQLKTGAVFINTSRGEVVHEAELDAFLRSRPDVTAVLDVRSSEPPKDDLFRDLPNVRLSPHIAAFTHAAQSQVLTTVLADVERVLSGGSPLWPAP